VKNFEPFAEMVAMAETDAAKLAAASRRLDRMMETWGRLMESELEFGCGQW